VLTDKAAPSPHRPAPYAARPRRTASPSVTRAGGGAQAATIKVIVVLTLAIRSLVEVIDGLGSPWRPLVDALLLALLALAFFAAATRSCDRRFGWLLSAAAAAGLAIAQGYGFVTAASTATVTATGVVVLLGILLMCAFGSGRAR
jgi:hypothetical protein